MYLQQAANSNETKTLLTLPNIEYMVQGLDVSFYKTTSTGDNRIKAIELRDGLLSYITGIFSDLI